MVSYDELKDIEKIQLLSCGLNEVQAKWIYNMFASENWIVIIEDIKEFVIRILQAVKPVTDCMLNIIKELDQYMDREDLFEEVCYSLKPIKYLSKCKNYNINHSVKRLNKLYIPGNRLRAYEELEEE